MGWGVKSHNCLHVKPILVGVRLWFSWGFDNKENLLSFWRRKICYTLMNGIGSAEDTDLRFCKINLWWLNWIVDWLSTGGQKEICPDTTWWFLETDIFYCPITQYLKAHESLSYMKNFPDMFPFWYKGFKKLL